MRSDGVLSLPTVPAIAARPYSASARAVILEDFNDAELGRVLSVKLYRCHTREPQDHVHYP